MFLIFVEPACGERDIVITTSVWCKCMLYVQELCASVQIWPAITCTFVHGFQKKFGSVVVLEE